MDWPGIESVPVLCEAGH